MESEREWDHATRQTYKDLIAIRKASSALAFGGLEWLSQGENHLVYLRDDGKERIISILMRAADEVHLHESQLENNGFELVLGSTPISRDGKITLTLNSPGFSIIRLK